MSNYCKGFKLREMNQNIATCMKIYQPQQKAKIKLITITVPNVVVSDL